VCAYLTYDPVLFSQLVLDEELCVADDLPPRLWIPSSADAPWNTMVLQDNSPAAAAPPDLGVAPERLTVGLIPTALRAGGPNLILPGMVNASRGIRLCLRHDPRRNRLAGEVMFATLNSIY
jgi:hypothetical protein